MDFSHLSTTVEWVEWMWIMSGRSGCGQYLKRIFILRLQFFSLEIHSMCFLFVLMIM